MLLPIPYTFIHRQSHILDWENNTNTHTQNGTERNDIGNNARKYEKL